MNIGNTEEWEAAGRPKCRVSGGSEGNEILGCNG